LLLIYTVCNDPPGIEQIPERRKRRLTMYRWFIFFMVFLLLGIALLAGAPASQPASTYHAAGASSEDLGSSFIQLLIAARDFHAHEAAFALSFFIRLMDGASPAVLCVHGVLLNISFLLMVVGAVTLLSAAGFLRRLSG
jgi:hypothetical protein